MVSLSLSKEIKIPSQALLHFPDGNTGYQRSHGGTSPLWSRSRLTFWVDGSASNESR